MSAPKVGREVPPYLGIMHGSQEPGAGNPSSGNRLKLRTLRPLMATPPDPKVGFKFQALAVDESKSKALSS